MFSAFFLRSILACNSPFFRCFLILDASDAILLIAVILCDALLCGCLSCSGTFDFGFLFWFCQVFWSMNWAFLVVFCSSLHRTCGAHRCDSMQSLSCSGVFGFGCFSFPFRLYKLFWPVIKTHFLVVFCFSLHGMLCSSWLHFYTLLLAMRWLTCFGVFDFVYLFTSFSTPQGFFLWSFNARFHEFIG
jgi:hypothetical protein